MNRHGPLSALLAMVLSTASESADWRGEIALEGRWFGESALDPAQHDSNLSLSGALEYHSRWDDRRQSLTLRPFARVDQHDGARTHLDLREAVWLFHDDGLEVRLGVDKVFWGVTEVLHLVDIINQTDVLENPDGEQKLGQPMLKVSFEQTWGTLDLYLLPWFRERRFPTAEGRPRTQPRVDDTLSRFENDREAWHTDIAARWSRNLGDWDLGLAWFHGTGREPSLRSGLDAGGRPVLIPRYEIIHQASLDLQGVTGDWLWKLEALYRKGQGAGSAADGFGAATGGFEYTFYGLFESSADLGTLVELMWDERGAGATTPFNRDLFVGLRWVANDIDGSEVLAGMVRDWRNGSRFVNVEASRRIGNDWTLGLQARVWDDIDSDDLSFGLRRDDYIELKLTRFF